MTASALPPEFDPAAYRLLHPAFADLADEQLLDHYLVEGKREGFPSNGIPDRYGFAALIPPEAAALEIGPFASPVLRGPNVCYCDVLDTPRLRERALDLGIDPAAIPHIDHVMGPRLLDDVPGTYDAILSSHAIEHQPDLVAHLLQVERRLGQAGRYFLMVPDHRFCFDHDIAPSTIADVLQAHEEQRKVHSLKSVIEHRALTVHNDAGTHWEHRASVLDGRAVAADKVRAAVQEYRASGGTYIDVHAWYFTPDSFRHILRLLGEMGLVALRVERLYRTRRGANEFWVVLSRQPSGAGPWDAQAGSDEPAGDDPRLSGGPLAVQADATRPTMARQGLLLRTLRNFFSRSGGAG